MAFMIFAASLVAFIAAAIAGSQTKPGTRLRGAMGAVTVVSGLLLLGSTAAGLWEAWSPWELVQR